MSTCRNWYVLFLLLQISSIHAYFLANADGFQCAANQNHILCQCCIQPMPDRRDEANIHQHCSSLILVIIRNDFHPSPLGEICHQFFCHIYFQPCQRMGCLGCLNRLRGTNDLFMGNANECFFFRIDFNFAARHLNELVNDNPVESKIVQVKLLSIN